MSISTEETQLLASISRLDHKLASLCAKAQQQPIDKCRSEEKYKIGIETPQSGKISANMPLSSRYSNVTQETNSYRGRHRRSPHGITNVHARVRANVPCKGPATSQHQNQDPGAERIRCNSSLERHHGVKESKARY